MRDRGRLRTIVSALSLCAAAAAAGQAHAPTNQAVRAPLAFTGYVVDQAGVLSPAVKQLLTARLGRFERETKHQLAVVTVASLGGEDVETFTIRLGNRWGVGRRGLNDGIVILVAPNERRARISVGDGLKRALPDDFCQAVMDRIMVPAFERN